MAQHSLNSHLLNVLEKMNELTVTVVNVQAENKELKEQGKEKDIKIEKLEGRLVKIEHFLKKWCSWK